jgi:hypothetical protein
MRFQQTCLIMYDKYTDDELIEAYTSMIDYSGNANVDILMAIQLRGGLEAFKNKIERKKIVGQETKRVSDEIYPLITSSTNADFIKKVITSDILTKNELNELIEKRVLQYQSFNKNREINFKTIAESISGVVVASIVGAGISCLIIVFLNIGLLIFFVIPIYIINYVIIRLITGKTRSNLIVFLATLIATIDSILLGLYFAAYFLPST